MNQLPIVAFPDNEQTLLNAQFDELHHILQAHGIFTQERAISTLRTLLLHAAEFKLQTATNTDAFIGKQKRLSPLVVNFQNLVENTYTQHQDTAFYSEALGVSTTTLNRRIKQELGSTVMQAVTERLAIAARVALRSGERPVKEVAFELGSEDPLYFSRFFRKQFGSSPSQYFKQPKVNSQE